MLKDFQGYIPKGEVRKRLRRKGRVSEIQVSRSFSTLQVKNCIRQAFKHLCVKNFSVLETDSSGHFLIQSASQEIDGLRTVTRRGALYLCEVNETCSLAAMQFLSLQL